jgi:hypothetical protein
MEKSSNPKIVLAIYCEQNISAFESSDSFEFSKDPVMETMRAQLDFLHGNSRLDVIWFTDYKKLDDAFWMGLKVRPFNGNNEGQVRANMYQELIEEYDKVIVLSSATPHIDLDLLQLILYAEDNSPTAEFIVDKNGGVVLYAGNDILPAEVFTQVEYQSYKTSMQLIQNISSKMIIKNYGESYRLLSNTELNEFFSGQFEDPNLQQLQIDLITGQLGQQQQLLRDLHR